MNVMTNSLRLVALTAMVMVGLPGSSAAMAATSQIRPTGLRCEYRENPLGIDVARPRLSWTLEGSANARGLAQSAWQVLVAGDPEKLVQDQGDLWDSGKVISDQQIHIEYAGRPLGFGSKVLLEDSRLGSKRSGLRLECAGVVDDGTAQTRRLAGEVDRRHELDGRATSHPVARLPWREPAARIDDVKWVQVDLGTERVLEEVKLHPTTPAGFEHVKGFGFPIRFRIDASNDPEFQKRQVIADLTDRDFPSPGDEPCSFPAKGVRGR